MMEGCGLDVLNAQASEETAIGTLDEAMHIVSDFENIKNFAGQMAWFEDGKLNTLKQYIGSMLYTANASDSLATSFMLRI